MIEKFAPNPAVHDPSDPHRFLDAGLLRVIEAEGDQEHLVDADGMGTQRAKPQPGAGDILHDHLATRVHLARLGVALGIGAGQLRSFPIAGPDDDCDPKERPAGAPHFERLGQVFHGGGWERFTPVIGLTG